MTAFDEPIAHHLGFAVHDADVTAARYTQMLGAKFKLQPIYELEDIYGRPAKLKVYYGAFAGMAIEIIEPFEGDTPHATFLREHGEGIQHLGIWVPDVKQATADLVAKGARLTWVYAREQDDPEAARAAAPAHRRLARRGGHGRRPPKRPQLPRHQGRGHDDRVPRPLRPRRHLPPRRPPGGPGGVDPGLPAA